MNDQFPDATKMVPDGYYFANVWDDSGRVQRELVRVAGGKLYNESGKVLFPAAVSDFKPATTADLCALWPWTAASELTTLRTENAALVERVGRLQDECRIAILRAERAEERVRRLEEVGDAMAHAEGCMCDDGVICHRCFDRARDWRKAKATQ